MSASSAALTAMSRIERTLGIEDLSLGVVPRLELAMAGAAMTARLPDLLAESAVAATQAGAPLSALSAKGYAMVARTLHGDITTADQIDEIETITDTSGTYVRNSTRAGLFLSGFFRDPLRVVPLMSEL
jgi:hypothetical protein